MTTDTTLNRKLHRLTQIYRLPIALNDKYIILNSSTDSESYHSIIQPLNHNSSNYNEFGEFTAKNVLEDDADYDKNNTNIIIIGNSILNNGGIPLANLSKIPSYQWGFKHDDETYNVNNLNTSHSESLGLGKYLLSGLQSSNEISSISSLPGTLPNHKSMALNSRLVRLPLKNDTASNVNDFDSQNFLIVGDTKQGGENRSIMNGLPYYDKYFIDKIIKYLNVEKRENWKSFNTNTSWFSDYLNETVDDIEYLHGAVILNQFVNNKRILRNFQWLVYWNEKIGGRKLNINETEGDTVDLREWEIREKIKKTKFDNIRKTISALMNDLNQITVLKNEKKQNHILKFGSLPFLIDDNNSKECINFYGTEIVEKENKIKDELKKIPKYEEEIEITKEEIDAELGENSAVISTFSRFGNNELFEKKNEFIINKEFSIDDPKLFNIHSKIYGVDETNKMIQDSKSALKANIVKSKIVKIRRRPNPNAMGFSNIRSRKPSFL